MDASVDLSLLGPLCAFGSSVTWAIGSTAYSRLSNHYSAFSVNFARALVALPLFILATFLVSGGWSQGLAHYQAVQASHWGWLTLSMIASYGLGDTFFLWSTRSLGIPGALAIASCCPFWTVLAGYFFLGEKLTISQFVGLFIAIGGVITVVLNGPKTETGAKKFSWLGFLFAVGASIGWATNSFATSRGGLGLLPPVGNTIRMFMALILSGCFARFMAPSTSVLLPKKQIFQFLWVFVLEAFGGSYFYIYGLSHSPLALGSTLASLAPVISVPVTLVLGIEKFSIFRTLGVILVVLGVWLLLGSF